MKNIKINHEFTLKELLESIIKRGNRAESYNVGYDNMIRLINEYLEMIK